MTNRGTLTLLFLASILLCSSIRVIAAGPCRSTDLVITQTKTNKVVEGKPEYIVFVKNACNCAQSRVLVRCYGLSSVEAVDARAIKPVDDEKCMLGNGRPISKGTPLRFKYAWMTPQDFPILSSQIHC